MWPEPQNSTKENSYSNSGNQRRCFEVLRTSLPTFQALVNWLGINTELKGSRTQAGTRIEEKLMIFLYIISRGASNRDTAERFSCSGRTISKLLYINKKRYY
jgi:hypothetical protein